MNSSRVAVVIPEGLASLDADRLRPPVHTVVAVEEPESTLAPQYLGRIIHQLRAACDFGDVTWLIATHAPTVLRRVDPHSICFLGLKPCTMREFDDGRCAHGVPDTAGRSFTSLRKSRTATVGRGLVFTAFRICHPNAPTCANEPLARRTYPRQKWIRHAEARFQDRRAAR